MCVFNVILKILLTILIVLHSQRYFKGLYILTKYLHMTIPKILILLDTLNIRQFLTVNLDVTFLFDFIVDKNTV